MPMAICGSKARNCLVRPDDIGPGNSVNSNRIAQANVTYTGAGDIANATKQGWYGQAVNVLSPL